MSSSVVFFLILCLISLVSCEDGDLKINQSSKATAVSWVKVKSEIKKDPKIEKRAANILSKMTLEEKVGQMIQAEIQNVTPDDIRQYHLGSVLNGGGSFPNTNKYSKVSDWVTLADRFYLASTDKTGGRTAVPILWGTDAVHGHNNVFGATIFPHNIGLGATNNPRLIEKIGRATATEVLATGIDWIFAPTVAVAKNDRWGRTYESYSEDPTLVKQFSESVVSGIQGRKSQALDQDHLISTVKHFLGDGGTVDGIDQGDNIASELILRDQHAQGYFSGLKAGAQVVMASFNSWNGKKIHESRYLLTTVLKEKMGFDGFVVGDWNGHGQVKGCSNDSCPQAIMAGLDMFMAPQDWKKLHENTVAQVKEGRITLERIDDAVTRILRVKLRAGLFEMGRPSTRSNVGNEKIVGSQKHRALARQAVRESLVLLKNKDNLLPLDANLYVLVAGSVANDIGRQSGGWTLTWQGTGNQNSDFPGGSSIYDGIKQVVEKSGGQVELSSEGSFRQKPDVAIVVFGEKPYAEGQGDSKNLYYGEMFPEDIQLLRKLKKQGIKVVSVFITGRPLWTNPEINQSDAFVVAWLPGSEGAGVSDVLFKKDSGKINSNFKGKLSFSWPNFADQDVLNPENKTYRPLFAYGCGLRYGDVDPLDSPLSEKPFQNGPAPKPEDRVVVFKGRTFAPFLSYVGDYANWKYRLTGDIGKSRGALVTVLPVDKDVQEDARKIDFKGGDSNYYFQSQKSIDLRTFVSSGQLIFDLRVDKKPNDQVNLLMGLSKLDVTQFLKNSKKGKWKKIGVDLRCFEKLGTDFENLDMPFSLATFGSFTVSLANIEIRKEKLIDSALGLIPCP